MVKYSLKIFQQMLQDFQSVSDHFGTLCIKGLKLRATLKPTKESFGFKARMTNRLGKLINYSLLKRSSGEFSDPIKHI